MAQSPMFINNKYTRWYYSLCERGRTRTINEYTESHHIIPESFFSERTRPGPKGWLSGNPNDPSNLSDLTDREHELAHYLLTKMCRDNKRAYFKVLKAYEMRSLVNKNQENKRYFSSRRLAGIRAERARLQSEMMRGENNPMFGDKFYRSPEAEARRIEAITGDNNVMKNEEAKQAMRDLKTGVKRAPFSQEWLDNLSISHSGEGNGMYGKNHRDDTRRLLSELASLRTYSEKTNEKRRVASGGRKEITDGVTYKKVKVDELQSWIDKGWIVKGKPRRKRKVEA